MQLEYVEFGAVQTCKTCRSSTMVQEEYLVYASISLDTAENAPSELFLNEIKGVLNVSARVHRGLDLAESLEPNYVWVRGSAVRAERAAAKLAAKNTGRSASCSQDHLCVCCWCFAAFRRVTDQSSGGFVLIPCCYSHSLPITCGASCRLLQHGIEM